MNIQILKHVSILTYLPIPIYRYLHISVSLYIDVYI